MILDALIVIFLGIGPWIAILALIFTAFSHKE